MVGYHPGLCRQGIQTIHQQSWSLRLCPLYDCEPPLLVSLSLPFFSESPFSHAPLAPVILEQSLLVAPVCHIIIIVKHMWQSSPYEVVQPLCVPDLLSFFSLIFPPALSWLAQLPDASSSAKD